MECDVRTLIDRSLLLVFQSTHSHGVRRFDRLRPSAYFFHFNPRTHMECDYASWLTSPPNRAFQSTHSHGVRHYYKAHNIKSFQVFQSTHSHGVRHATNSTWLKTPCRFQSTHSHGVRQNDRRGIPPAIGDFNPRTHMECDGVNVHSCFLNSISIHALTWSATLNQMS